MDLLFGGRGDMKLKSKNRMNKLQIDPVHRFSSLYGHTNREPA